MDKEKLEQMLSSKVNPEIADKFKNVDLNKLIETNNINYHIPKITTPTIKKELISKTGIEGWYEKHIGKITITLAVVTLVQGIIIYLLSR